MAGGRAVRSDYPVGMVAETYDYIIDAELYNTEPDYINTLCEVKTTTKAQERRTSVVEASDPRERAEGVAMTPEKPIEGYTIYCAIKNWYKEQTFTREVAQDHQRLRNFAKKTTGGWVTDFRRGRNKRLMRLFNRGGFTSGDTYFNGSLTGGVTDPSGNLMYDSEPLFNLSDNTRASQGGGTYYNALANTLTPANFETLWSRMTVTNAYNEDDTEVTISPDLLLVNNTIKFTAERIFRSELLAGSTTNDINVLKDKITVIGTNLFTDTDGYVLMQAKKGLIHYKRETPIVEMWYKNESKLHYMSMEERDGNMPWNFRFFAASGMPVS